MRFTIPSHLTPEWRKHFIRYDALKRMVYAIVEDASDEGSLLDADGRRGIISNLHVSVVHIKALCSSRVFSCQEQAAPGGQVL